MVTPPSYESRQFERRPGIRPRQTLGRRLDAASRAALPAAIAVVLLLLLHAPLGLPAQPALLLGAELACVFYWSLFLPRVMPSPVVFVLGLLVDLLGTGPLGLSVVLLLIAHVAGIAWRQALMRQGALVIWLVFAGVAALCCLIEWLATMLLEWRLLPPGSAALQFGFALGEYLVLSGPFAWCMRVVARPHG
ncbi:rod shape-determining protein MreD [Endobacter medicaginis]|uniref:Rod shape-determining protein MreD n=2 Tax=Endobacter medicaginis TaxID=1181271 RepID=A0A839UXJ8_9PROT|nr:hypothetical protein [Endobacter medicaginis]MBB3172820.1 rod shape-determining protein MreD [Endobacter medicaginis]MCX5474427.1 hypothetical protein [Endobacter medicaginis]